MYITILGSGAALPLASRHCSAQVVNIGGAKILIDCGEGTQDRIRHNHIKLQSIATILLSHLHGDHFFGLPGLLSTMHLCGRKEEITVVAPRGAQQAIEQLFELSGNHVDYPIRWVELDFEQGEQLVVENNRFHVEAFPIFHSVPAFGYRISEVAPSGRPPYVYTYCCDTVYDPRLIPHLEGAQLLCLECTFSNEYERLAAERKHLTAGQAAQLAADAHAKHLLLTHISARFREPEPLVSQAQSVFQNVTLVADNMRFELRENLVQLNMQPSENK